MLIKNLERNFSVILLYSAANKYYSSASRHCTNPSRIPISSTTWHRGVIPSGTPHRSIPLRITFRSCQGETQKHGSTCLLRITLSHQIISLEKFIRKGRRENFYSVELFWYRRNVLIELNCTELQKIYAQYKQSLYNQLGIVKMTYSI